MDAATTSAPATPSLTRDDEHKYWLIDPPKPPENLWGVNQVIIDNRLENNDFYTEEHSSRGRAIHGELANVANGCPPFPFLDPDLGGWCASGYDFLNMIARDGAVILFVEVMRYHPLYRVAGTIDLLALWRGYEWVLDWKSGKASKMTRFKLAAYDMILGPALNGKQRKRAAIELDRDGGRAHLVEYNEPKHFHDANRFLSYLNTSRDRALYNPK